MIQQNWPKRTKRTDTTNILDESQKEKGKKKKKN